MSAAQIDVPLSRAADSVTVITAADLQARQIETVADALRLVPGLTVTRSGGRGAITSLFPRGGASNYTLVLVDGIRANAFGGGYDFGHLSVADVDRIEIVRGPESALFGSDAIGAVVQIVTRRGGRPRADGLVEGGSQGTERAALGAAGSRGDWTLGRRRRADAQRRLHRRRAGHRRARQQRRRPADARIGNDRMAACRTEVPTSWSPGTSAATSAAFLVRSAAIPIGAFTASIACRAASTTRARSARGSPIRGRRACASASRRTTPTSPSDFRRAAIRPSRRRGTRRFDGRVQEDIALSPPFGASAGVEFPARARFEHLRHRRDRRARFPFGAA